MSYHSAFTTTDFIAAGWVRDAYQPKFVCSLRGCPQGCRIEVAEGPGGENDLVMTVHYGGHITRVPRIGGTYRLAPPAPAVIPGGPLGVALDRQIQAVSRALYAI